MLLITSDSHSIMNSVVHKLLYRLMCVQNKTIIPVLGLKPTFFRNGVSLVLHSSYLQCKRHARTVSAYCDKQSAPAITAKAICKYVILCRSCVVLATPCCYRAPLVT